jgi:hypothetical protein
MKGFSTLERLFFWGGGLSLDFLHFSMMIKLPWLTAEFHRPI